MVFDVSLAIRATEALNGSTEARFRDLHKRINKGGTAWRNTGS
jgi:hypothetical protein